jgi:hypothetical protein
MRPGRREDVMVRWMRSANVKGAKFMEAIGWSKEMVGYCEKAYGVKMHVFLDAFGDTTTMRWMIDQPDLATTEKAMEKALSDPEYFKRVSQAIANGIFVDGSTVDVITREL